MKHRLEISAFSSGAIVMIFEILGSRILGSYVGTSIYVWTNIIALILGALALGYYVGGKLSDKGVSIIQVGFLFSISGLLFAILPLIKDPILIILSENIGDIRVSSFIATLILFTPASFILGMIQPICTKIHIKDIESSGKSIGIIGSIGTIGSIIGTMAAGFILIPFFGINNLLLGLAIFCMVLSIFILGKNALSFNLLLFCFIVLIFFTKSFETEALKNSHIFNFDSQYSHISIQDGNQNGIKVRNLFVDNIPHAGRYLESEELLYDYTQAYHLFHTFNPEAQKIVMFGGAAYSFPQSFLQQYPNKTIDVIEIDPKMTQLAQDFFGLNIDEKNLKIFHQDARVFINQNDNKYDAILGDAFGSFYSIPQQLTTRETVKRKIDMLNENGVVLLNMIGSLAGKNSYFIASEYKTYAEIFPEVFLLPIENQDPEEIQNILLVALKNSKKGDFTSDIPFMNSILERKSYLEIHENIPILTDDYAPVEYLISKMSL